MAALRIDDHPFYVLGIAPRSGRQEMLERAEACGAGVDPERISSCRMQVTHPAKRVDAEVSWFPGMPPAGIRRVVEAIKRGSKTLPIFQSGLRGVDPLWTFNAVIYWLAATEDESAVSWELVLPRLAESLSSVDPPELMATLNADRAAAGMPEIPHLDAVLAALRSHEQSAAAAVAERLLRGPEGAEALTSALRPGPNDSVGPAWDFIARIVDRYQVLIQWTLNQQAEDAAAWCEEALSSAEASAQGTLGSGPPLRASIEALDAALSRWGEAARPVQVLMKLRGLQEPGSTELATRVRGTAVKLANEFGLHDEALQIIRALYNEFAEVPDLAELLKGDLNTLGGIIEAKYARQAELADQPGAGASGVEIRCPECRGPMVLQGQPNAYVCNDPLCRDVQAFAQFCTLIEAS